MTLLGVLLTQQAQAVLTVKITKGIEGAQPIAVVPFGWSGAEAPPQDVGAIIAANLARSGRFAPLPTQDLPSQPSARGDVSFKDWRILGTPNLVVGELREQGGDNYVIEFSLLDVYRGESIDGSRFTVTAGQLRNAAHQISDIIFEKLTGERGAFSTRIAYITETDDGPTYTLNVADSDGFGEQNLLRSKHPVLSPTWSPDGKNIAYVSFQSGQPRIYVQELATGKQRRLTQYPGLNSAPAWSPDGRRLAVVLSKDGNPEIYVIDISGEGLQRLTNNPAIDTEPAWSPDGRQLVFTSDRGGKQQIYRIPAIGGRGERVTFEGESNARATYSPNGKSLALVHGVQGKDRIAILDLERRALKVLTDTSLDESPSFSPNGDLILYATNDAEGPTLAAVSVDGRVRQRLGVRGSAVREPAWGPFR